MTGLLKPEHELEPEPEPEPLTRSHVHAHQIPQTNLKLEKLKTRTTRAKFLGVVRVRGGNGKALQWVATDMFELSQIVYL